MNPSVPSRAAESSSGGVPSPAPKVVRIGSDLHLAAACRIVGQNNPDIEHAARRLVTASGKHGIDLNLVFATVEPGPVRRLRQKVRQTCLAVLGSGRTAMLFLSEPPPEGDAGGPLIAAAERSACVRAACEYLLKNRPKGVRIAQSLPEPEHAWAIDACRSADFMHVGTLSYMRRSLGGAFSPELPDLGPNAKLVTYAAVRDEHGPAEADARFRAALDESYLETLDCPELCGLRDTADVLESHRTTGKFDPRLWWLILGENGGPLGCLLLNPCPEQSTVELVYIGLSKAGRGLGWGRKLLTFGMSQAGRMNPTFDIACAVDERNVPARKLYESLGFRAWSRRVALVRPL